ncbi:S41 family peptidase [Salinimicrobium soli]|uniref:S41 family peptidase n=1 Tax=Salinimicrobium soli TaxID=1254399 RepID=UPI003AB0C000
MKKLIFLIMLAFSGSAFSQMSNSLTESEKIYGLSKFWQEVNYNFVYYDKVDKKEWEDLYKKTIVEVQQTKTDYEYYRVMEKFCASLKDGHTNVFFPREIDKNINRIDFGAYRFLISNIDGRAVITGINASKKQEIPIGTEIIKVNGLSSRQYIKENVEPYISSSTSYVLEDWGISRMLWAPMGTTFQLELRLPDGKIKNLKVTAEKSEEEELYPPMKQRELLEFKWLNDGIAYVALNSFDNEKINSLFIEKLPELYKAKKLIIDLRNNGGGSTWIGKSIFEYLTNDSLLYGSKTQTRQHISVYKAWGKWVEPQDTIDNPQAKQMYSAFRDQTYFDLPYSPEQVDLKAKRIVVPTVLLIGHNTASAAEDFLIYADNQPHMTILGEPSFGSTGQPLMFDMPGGGYARICTKKDTYPDGREFVGVGVQPDIMVSKKLSDFLEEKDPVLEKAVEFLKAKKAL